MQSLSTVSSFQLLRLPDTHLLSRPSLSHALHLSSPSAYHSFLLAPTYLSLLTSLVLLCFDLFYLYYLPASRLSCLLVEHAAVSALARGMVYAQMRRDLGRRLVMYQQTLRKSVEINQTIMQTINKTNVT